jgi:predicted nuclease of predicted toxin-antitoxin system
MPPEPFIIFLDENHCNNKRILRVLEDSGIAVERHLDHFPRGTPDEDWLPFVGKNGWALVTTDARIRYRSCEKLAVRENSVRMFYFSSNNLSGQQMAETLRKALPAMQTSSQSKSLPFSRLSRKPGPFI